MILLTLILLAACAKKEEEVQTLRLNPFLINIELRSKVNLKREFAPPTSPEEELSAPEVAKVPEAKPGTPSPPPVLKPAPALEPYKSDPEYLAINRYEIPYFALRKRAQDTSLSLKPDYEANRPKISHPLVFAGRGFEIDSFQDRSQEKVKLAFTKHLEQNYPHQLPQRPPDHLVQEDDYIRHKKFLIFNPANPVWGPVPELDFGPETEKDIMEETGKVLDPVPETFLLLDHGNATRLILKPAPESIDLILGNEKVNEHWYENR
ncbi:MAG: hypothetical protein COV67_08155 [Nitrospinae bacterium CG11_big_fil_rev_8_21_14_0_20_56_8]|nr:MAG: hypothetical protein COV67_08155 [Nitrospinae bacterium CG11_big_fil_rev_8_21_14_0_20_56_8]